jgi:hypothetical protein
VHGVREQFNTVRSPQMYHVGGPGAPLEGSEGNARERHPSAGVGVQVARGVWGWYECAERKGVRCAFLAGRCERQASALTALTSPLACLSHLPARNAQRTPLRSAHSYHLRAVRADARRRMTFPSIPFASLERRSRTPDVVHLGAAYHPSAGVGSNSSNIPARLPLAPSGEERAANAFTFPDVVHLGAAYSVELLAYALGCRVEPRAKLGTSTLRHPSAGVGSNSSNIPARLPLAPSGEERAANAFTSRTPDVVHLGAAYSVELLAYALGCRVEPRAKLGTLQMRSNEPDIRRHALRMR